LEEVELRVFVENKVLVLIYPVWLANYKKKEAKVRQIILYSMKNYLIPHIAKKKMTKEKCDDLIGLYQSVTISHKIHLRNKISTIHMSDKNCVDCYLMKIIEYRDQFSTMRMNIEYEDLTSIALNGFSPS
jgi:hypothetical protein